jgi:hypothetical protein
MYVATNMLYAAWTRCNHAAGDRWTRSGPNWAGPQCAYTNALWWNVKPKAQTAPLRKSVRPFGFDAVRRFGMHRCSRPCRETTVLLEQVFSVTYDPSGNGGRGSFFFNPDGEVPAATPHVAACSGTLMSVESLRVACYGAFSCTLKGRGLAPALPTVPHALALGRQSLLGPRAISRCLCLCVRATAYVQCCHVAISLPRCNPACHVAISLPRCNPACHVAISLLDRSHCARCPRAHA